MRKLLIFIFLSSAVFADCGPVQIIPIIRPGAEWIYNDNSGLIWLDKIQGQPTPQEISDAITNCKNQKTVTDVQKQAAKVTLKDMAATDTQKLNAVITILDLAK